MYFKRPKDIEEWGISIGILAGVLTLIATLFNRCSLLSNYFSLLETEIVSMFIAFTGISVAYIALLVLGGSFIIKKIIIKEKKA
jgi:hypothetical protein